MDSLLTSLRLNISGRGISSSRDPKLAEFHKKYLLTDKILGTGSYAQVRLAKLKTTMDVVAVKIIRKGGLSKRELTGLHKEVNILSSLSHKNVVAIFDHYDTEKAMYIVMEYVDGGELFESLATKSYTEEDVKKVIFTLAQALKHCKENGVIHRDLKPQNLLLTRNGEVKLADFNLSIKIDKDQANFSLLQTACGTPNYVSPEVLSMKPYSYKCDIWSLGVVTFLLLSGGYLPFNVDEEGEEGKDLLLELVRIGRWDFTPREAWKDISPDAKDFLRKVMEARPERRVNYDELLHHRWMKGQYDNVIDNNHFKNSHFRRKMLAAGKSLQAVAAFQSLVDGKKIHKPQLNPEFSLSGLGQSSQDGFVLYDY
eukprot:augustus_masked-scaffold_22-processed-gene-2.43-mRNA-1 protein AED:0.08 eAED:0.21 QI:0/-1/0/1/-1/1/1/0/368